MTFGILSSLSTFISPAELMLVTVFCLGYLAIIFESVLHIDKAAWALLTGVCCWMIVYGYYDSFNIKNLDAVTDALNHNLYEISDIVFFLMSAMTIIELIDSHNGFTIVARLCKTKSPLMLLYVCAGLSFFMSAILDNLTTTIVMVSILKRIVPDAKLRYVLGSIVVISANAGGVWTPIGDVTTTMLWIKDRLTTVNIMQSLFIPSLVVLITTCLIESFRMKTQFELTDTEQADETLNTTQGSTGMFVLGLSSLIAVPVLRAIFNNKLPPFMAIFFGLSLLWIATDYYYRRMEGRDRLKVTHALTMIDSSCLLFFMGILLSVGALAEVGLLSRFSVFLRDVFVDDAPMAFVMGVVSGIIDNVPLVAASIEMYQDVAQNEPLWEMIALAAGTGGSITIIGSAAGIALMGMEQISFIWHLKRMFITSFVSYTAGFLCYYVMNFPLY
ncbi:sodium:proton antiporter NhaD [Chlamydiia bacterium]|nr:sodium:proton antiporter NhaD [Chlamydiia bacterium]